MDKDFDKMTEELTGLAELKAYSEAQYKTIIELSKKINKLEEENKDLRSQVQNSVPKDPSADQSKYVTLAMGDDHEVIAKIQLNKIKEVCFDRELTLDEVKRVEILVKVLNFQKQSKEQKVKEQVESMNEADLIALVNDPSFKI